MIGKHVIDGLHWLRLAIFKPFTFREEAKLLTTLAETAMFSKASSVGVVLILVIEMAIGGIAVSLGHHFDWLLAVSVTIALGLVGWPVVGLSSGLVIGLGMGLYGWLASNRPAGVVHEPAGALTTGLAYGLGLFLGAWRIGLIFGLGAGLAGGLYGGLGLGPLGGLLAGIGFGVVYGLGTELAQGPGTAPVQGPGTASVQGPSTRLHVRSLAGLASAVTLAIVILSIATGFSDAWYLAIGYLPAWLLGFFRPFYLLPHVLQHTRSRRATDPFEVFHHSPIYWDEVIAMPLPGLSTWLLMLVERDRERGLEEILFVASRRPYQRRAAQQALLALAIQDLRRIDSLGKLPEAMAIIASLPAEGAEYLPAGWQEARRRLRSISELAQDYSTRMTPVGQASVLEALRKELQSFGEAMILTKPPVGPAFQSITARWLALVRAAEDERPLDFTPVRNPFIVGNPLQPRDQGLFKGRRDIIVAIEENIINPAQRPALLLYGRRRIGKTSTLLNLPRLLSSQFVPVFIDCQNAKWREGDAVFCYQLATTIHAELERRTLLDGLRPPRLDEFEKLAFMRLDEYLDGLEALSRRARKQILLTLDEFERLEKGIEERKLTEEVLNQLRNIVQHRERLVVLFSGSHRFEELRVVNWSDYLINVKTLELSFLSPADARELLTRPVPDFNLEYDAGVVDEMIELTHGQPYLLQALASDLVNHLNAERRLRASRDDLALAVSKALVTAEAYFINIWKDECSDAERDVLSALATGPRREPGSPERALQGLYRKELVKRANGGQRFAVELFRRWILKNQVVVTEPPVPAARLG